MQSKRTGVRREGMTIQTLLVGERIYEQRLNRCGRRNCQVCYPPGGSGDGAPGHGPYWYMCVVRNGRAFRLYIGKDLNTARYVTAEGVVDWFWYRNRKKESKQDG